jgi:diguanylate cyclase (GGDEF)-like protein/PAS domain S-box-containing protein
MHPCYEVLEKIISNAPSSMFAMDRQHRYILTNPAHLQLVGLTQEQLIGYTEYEAFPQFTAAKEWTGNEHIMSTDQPLQVEEAFLLKNGQFMNVTTVKFPLHANGKVVGLCGIKTDISARKQAEKALHTSELIYSALFDNMLNGLAYCRMVLEQDQPVDFVFINVNNAFTTLMGRNDVIGRKASEVFPGISEQDQQLLEVCGRVALTGQSERLELFINSMQDWFSMSFYSLQAGFFVAVFDVITERKLTEELLVTSEKEFRLLSESMPQIVWIAQPDGMNIFFNQQWVNYTGLTLEESYGHGWNKSFHPDDRQTAWKAWQNAINNKGCYSIQCRIQRTDGIYRWWLCRGVPAFDDSGQVYKWFGTFTDIHAIKVNEQELQSTQAKLDSALNSMSDAILISDTEGVFIHFNEAFSMFHKFKNKEECAKSFAEYTQFLEVYLPDGELVPIEQWVIPRALRGEEASNVEFTLRRKDTGETWVGCYNYAPIHIESGGIAGSVVTCRDITEQKRTEQRRREAEAEWMSVHYTRNLIETCLDPLLTISSDGTITDVNTATEAVTGYSRDNLIGSIFADYFTDPMAAIMVYQQAFLAGSVRNYALKIHHRDGYSTPVLFNMTVYNNELEKIAGVFASARDISEIELIEKALKTSEALFKSLFNEAPLGIALVDSLTGQIYEVNPMFVQIAGRTIEEMKSIDWMSITHPDDVQECLDKMALLNAGKISRFFMEKRYLHLDGTLVWINMNITPVYVDDKAHPRHLCMIEDISERKITENKINQLAFHDPLTQLPNRRLLHERLKHSINVGRRNGKKLALLMLDLDRFKIVNDSFGHLAGDKLLQKVAERITARLRDVDMVARMGGDEFVVLLENITQPEDAARVANEIIADLSNDFCLAQSDSIKIGASIGISLYPQHGTNPEMLIDHADAALYQAKEAGRGCFF